MGSLTLPVIMGRIFSGFVLICLCFHSTRSQSSYSQGSNYGYQPNVAPRVCDHSRDCLKPNEFCVDTQQGPGCKCLNGYQWDETSRDCLCVLGLDQFYQPMLGGNLCSRCFTGQHLVHNYGKVYCEKDQVYPQPGYNQPQQTGYDQPQQTGYDQPQQTGYDQPQQTGYSQPQQTGYYQPQQTGYNQDYQAPQTNLDAP